MEQNEKNDKLLSKLIQLQCEIPTLPKDAKGYGYKYTTLDTIRSALLPLLQKYGIGIFQPLSNIDGQPAIVTKIVDTEGGCIEYITPLPSAEMAKMNEVQANGATMTYYRRYALCSLLCITADEDVDANIPQQKPMNVNNSQKTVVSNISEDLNDKKKRITDMVNSGVLSGDWAKKAMNYVMHDDVTGIDNVLRVMSQKA